MFYDSKGRLTRDGAVNIINSGGTVLHAGKLYTSVAMLPGEADFAKGDPVAESAARARLQQQITDAQKQLDSLTQSAAPAKENAKVQRQ